MQIEELKRCADSFSYFAEHYIKLSSPKDVEGTFKLFPFQLPLVEKYAKHRFLILNKFRQGGFTTLSVLHALWMCMFKADQNILVTSKTDREAVHIGKIVTRVLDRMPEWLTPKMGKNTAHQKQFAATNSTLNFHAMIASRGKAFTRLIIDEAAFIPNMSEAWKMVYPSIATGASCLVQSTTNGVGNWFHEIYQAAQFHENAFHVFHTDYREHPEMTDEFVAATRERLGEKGFLQEIEGNFVVEEDHPPRTTTELADDLLDIASRRRLSKFERRVLMEAACRLRYMQDNS